MFRPRHSYGSIDRLTNDEINAAWAKTVAERLDKIVFPAGDMVSADDFRRWVQRPSNRVVFMYDDSGELVAYFWTNNGLGHCAMFHFCMFKAGRRHKKQLADTAFKWCFAGGMTGLYALFPSHYCGVADLAKQCGFEYAGRLKGACMFLKPDGTTEYKDGIVMIKNKEVE